MGIGIALVVTFCVLVYWPTTFLFMGLFFIAVSAGCWTFLDDVHRVGNSALEITQRTRADRTVLTWASSLNG
jgi:hypothetical protein